MDKSPEAFRTISEVADELKVPKHVLRFWEAKFAQLKPMKRGGGRRYYRPEDVALLRGIRFLLYDDGYTIRGVQKILREQGLASSWSSVPLSRVTTGSRRHHRAGDSRRRRRGRPEPQLRQAAWRLRTGHRGGDGGPRFSAERARGLPPDPRPRPRARRPLSRRNGLFRSLERVYPSATSTKPERSAARLAHRLGERDPPFFLFLAVCQPSLVVLGFSALCSEGRAFPPLTS